jgi:cyclase
MKSSRWSTILIALCTVLSLFAQQDFAKVEIQTIPVAKNIYMLQGAGGNIGVSVGPDGILIVDDQFAPSLRNSGG